MQTQFENFEPSLKNSGPITPKLPGGEGIWVFVFGDLFIFTLFFSVFLYYRAESIELFKSASSTLNLTFGVFNTLVLLLSSWFMVCALKAFRLNNHLFLKRFTTLSIACGILFVLLKIFEYKEKITDDIGLTSNSFFMFYYVLTGIHLFHVALGLIILTWLYISIRKGTATVRVSTVEASCVFWHMVDLLWIVIFPLLYLLP